MEHFTSLWNTLMDIGVILGLASSAALLYALIVQTDTLSKTILSFVSKKILLIGFVISLAAMVSSLVYSNVIGYPPCLLCWYTRIAFYPQVFLFALALFKKGDRNILDYSLVLVSFGLAVSTYHYITESIQYSPLPCSAGGVSCLTRYVYEWGFITIPFMGLVGFLTLFLALWAAKKGSKISVS